MHDPTRIFERHRPRLTGVAYRMLGTAAEAEEVVQDAWLRWNDTDAAALDNSEAWLVTVTTRLAIDRLRAAKAQREQYIGLWLPEPLLTESPATPEEIHELSDDVSVAFLALLERLAPEARAAFLLREVFDTDYQQVAEAIGKSEAACRQIVHRAKAQLREARPRYAVSRDSHRRLLDSFAEALRRGSYDEINALLAEDAVLIGDGGGRVSSFPEPLAGGWRIAKLLHAAQARYGEGQRIELVLINGQAALLRYIDGALESAQSYETDGERIVAVQVQRNPDKLARLIAALQKRASA
jgi:RNA polymerase sigma-70 factor (ECF subfamily)